MGQNEAIYKNTVNVLLSFNDGQQVNDFLENKSDPAIYK